MLNVKQDEDGNYIVLEVKIEDYPFLLINIYDISNDTPFSFSILISLIEPVYSSQHFISGDDSYLIFDEEL